jgi:hypothetical protein
MGAGARRSPLDDRRDHFETSSDPWELLRIVVRERRAREFDPTTVALRALVADPDFERQDPSTQARLRETLHLMENLAQWTDDMLSLEPGMLMRLMRMGVRIQALLGRAKAARARRRARHGGRHDRRPAPRERAIEVFYDGSCRSARPRWRRWRGATARAASRSPTARRPASRPTHPARRRAPR